MDPRGRPAQWSAGLAAALESGEVLFFPDLAFAVHESERPLFSPAIVTTAKNISFDPRSGRIGGLAQRRVGRGRAPGSGLTVQPRVGGVRR